MSRVKVADPPVIHTPSFTEYSIWAEDLRPKLEALNIKIPCGFFDTWYYYTLPEDWANLLIDLEKALGNYVPEKFDCDDFSMAACAEVRKRYKLNAFGMCLGDTPMGYHAFCILYDGNGFWLYEPQSSEGVFPIGDKGYQVDKVII